MKLDMHGVVMKEYSGEKHINCAKCGVDIDVEKSICAEINGKTYCRDCFRFCVDCGKTFVVYDTDVYLCNRCLSHYYHCDYCGDLFRVNHLRIYNGGMICGDCYERENDDIQLYDYMYKPSACFHYVKQCENRYDNLYFGIELEIQGIRRNSFCSAVKDKFDESIFYLKRDGSLDEYDGVEIVSHPMTFLYIKQKKQWENMFDLMRQYDMNNVENCGLHFHLDKEYFSPEEIAVIDFIVNTFSEYFEKLGGRPFNDYCRKDNKNFEEWGKVTTDRYTAVNLNNKNTVELRFCESTIDYVDFLNKLKTMLTIAEFSKYYTFEKLYNMNEDEFVRLFEDFQKSLRI